MLQGVVLYVTRGCSICYTRLFYLLHEVVLFVTRGCFIYPQTLVSHIVSRHENRSLK